MIDNNNLTPEQISHLTPEQIAQIAAQAAANVNSDGARNANEVALKINKKVRDKSIAQENYAQRIAREISKNENCVTLVIPEIYRRYQPSFTASVNGCTVTIPADGKPRKVHRDFALIIMKRMNKLSKNIANMSAPDISEYKH